jgi:hypothetical protein
MKPPRHCYLVKVACVVVLCTSALALSGGDNTRLRGELVGWARLKTPSEYWNRHSVSDPVLMRFLAQNTTLNIDPVWHVADVERLDQMCAYPLLFSQGVHMVQNTAARKNIAEYVRRGGFLLIDACNNVPVNGMSHDEFLQRQIAFLADVLPEARVAPLPSTHAIYRCFFPIPSGHPPHTYWGGSYDAHKARHGVYAIQVGSRMVGLISLSGLQCGWDGVPATAGTDVACMKMLVNIYIYAVSQAGGSTDVPLQHTLQAPMPARPGNTSSKPN